MTETAQVVHQKGTVKMGHRRILRSHTQDDNSQFPRPPSPELRFPRQRNIQAPTGARNPRVNVDEVTFLKAAHPPDNADPQAIGARIHAKSGLSSPFRPHGGSATPPSPGDTYLASRSTRPHRQKTAPLSALDPPKTEGELLSPPQAARDNNARHTRPHPTREASLSPSVSSNVTGAVSHHSVKGSATSPPLPAYHGRSEPPPSPPAVGASPPIPRADMPPPVSSPMMHEATGSTASAKISESPPPAVATNAVPLPATPVSFDMTSRHVEVQPETLTMLHTTNDAVPLSLQPVSLIPVSGTPVSMVPLHEQPGAIPVAMSPPAGGIPVIMTPPHGAVRVVMTPPPDAFHPLLMQTHVPMMEPNVRPQQDYPVDNGVNVFRPVVNPEGSSEMLAHTMARLYRRREDLLRERRQRHALRESLRLWSLRSVLRRLQLEFCDVQYDLCNLMESKREGQGEKRKRCSDSASIVYAQQKRRDGKVGRQRHSREGSEILVADEKKCGEIRDDTQKQVGDSPQNLGKTDLQSCIVLDYAQARRLVLARSYALRASAGLFFTLQKILDKQKLNAFLAMDEAAISRFTRSSTRAQQLLLAPTARVRACIVPACPRTSGRHAADMRVHHCAASVSAMRYISRAVRRLILRQLGSAFWTVAWNRSAQTPSPNAVARAPSHVRGSSASSNRLSPPSTKFRASSELLDAPRSPASHISSLHLNYRHEQSRDDDSLRHEREREIAGSLVSNVNSAHSNNQHERTRGDDSQRRQEVHKRILNMPPGDVDPPRMSFGLSSQGEREDIDAPIAIMSPRSSVPWNVEDVDELLSVQHGDDVRSATDSFYDNRTMCQQRLDLAQWGTGAGVQPIGGDLKPRTPRRRQGSSDTLSSDIPNTTQDELEGPEVFSECYESQYESSCSTHVEELALGPPSARLLRTNMWKVDNSRPLKNNILVGARNIPELKSRKPTGHRAEYGKERSPSTPRLNDKQQEPQLTLRQQEAQKPREHDSSKLKTVEQKLPLEERDSPETMAMERQAVCKLVKLFMRPKQDTWTPSVEHRSKPMSETVIPCVKVSMDRPGQRTTHAVSPRLHKSPRSAPALVERMRGPSPRAMVKHMQSRKSGASQRNVVEQSPNRKMEPSPQSTAKSSPKKKKELSNTSVQTASLKRVKEQSPNVATEAESARANRKETSSKTSRSNDPQWRFSGVTQDSADTTTFWIPDGSTGDSATLRTSGGSGGTKNSAGTGQENTWAQILRKPAAWARKMLQEPHFKVKTPDLSAGADGTYPQTFNVYDMPMREYDGLYRRVDTNSSEVIYINNVGRSMWKVGDEWFFCKRLRGKPDIVSKTACVGTIRED